MISPVFAKNLALFERFDPLSAARLRTISLSAYDQPNHPNHSNHPIQEKNLQYDETINRPDILTVFVYGLGCRAEEFLHLKKWLRQNGLRTAVFLLDDWACLRQLFETSLATEMLTDPQVILKTFDWPGDRDWEKFRLEFEWFFRTFSTGKFTVLCKLSPTAKEIERVKRLDTEFHRNIDDWLRTFHNYLVGQKEAFSSYYPNLLELMNAKSGQGLVGAFSNIPAIICGAGPSLKKDLSQIRDLQNRALIFGSGSGLNILSRHGIYPHFAGGVDTTPTQVSRLSTNFAFQVPFFYSNRFNHKALCSVHGDRLWVRGGARLNVVKWFEEQLNLDSGPRIPPGMSTSNFCLEVAGILGCNPIILVGMDLSYKGSQRYTEGVTAHPAEERKHHADIDKKKSNLVAAKGRDGQEVITSWDWLLEAECFTEFCEKNSQVQVWNATEGGMAIRGIRDAKLTDLRARDLTRTYDFEALIHEFIERRASLSMSREKLEKALQNWADSLSFCKAALNRHAQELKNLEDSVQEGGTQEAAHLKTDLNDLLGKSPANIYCLEQLNDIFNALNGKEFFRMSHFKEAYPSWKQAQMTLAIEIERCKFLSEKLSEHLIKTEETQNQLSRYSPIIKTISNGAIKDVLVEELEGSQENEKTFVFYYLSGQVHSKRKWKDNKPEGKHEYFYIDGSLRSLISYKSGFLDGEVNLFYPGGLLKRSLEFVNGQLHGIERSWSKDGKLLSEASYLDNKPIGMARSWHANGVLAREIIYEEGSPSPSVTEWNEAGETFIPNGFQNLDLG